MALLSQLFTALLLLHFGLHLVGGSEAAASQTLSCPASAGVPGTPGHNGLPGRDGRDGRDGASGPKGERGEPGLSVHGPPGKAGPEGPVGPDGPKGQKGNSGPPGASHGELINSLQEELKSLTARFSLMEKAASYSTFVKVGQKFYVSDGLTKTFDDGVKFCSDAGGKLALPRNLEENQKLFGVLQVFGFQYVFIGANDQKTEGHFVDLEGNALDFFRWNKLEPNSYGGNEDCVVIDKNAHWCDTGCEHSLLIVCEIS